MQSSGCTSENGQDLRSGDCWFISMAQPISFREPMINECGSVDEIVWLCGKVDDF